MEDSYKIMLAGSKSKQSIPTNTRLNFGFERDYHFIENVDYRGIVDTNQVYLDERDACTTYRLIVTIDPICSNVLFNPTSIIVDKDYQRIFNTSQSLTPATSLIYEPSRGIFYNPPITYFCGYDIFDNVQFRTERFQRSKKLDSLVPLKPDPDKLPLETDNSLPLVHVYTLDDIDAVHTAVNNYLVEYNGWISFKNPNKLTIFQLKFNQNTKYPYDKIAIDKTNPYDTLNLENYFLPFSSTNSNCDTIDMFPNREMFSFNPMIYEEVMDDICNINLSGNDLEIEDCYIKVVLPDNSSSKHNNEDNWRHFITYPYRNEFKHWLVTGDDGENGIPIIFAEKLEANDEKNIKFNVPVGKFITAYPHNLQQSDRIYLTSDKKEYTILDIEDKYTAYLWIEGRNATDPLWNNARIRKIVNNTQSDYYIRIFRKLPNWKFEEEQVTNNNLSQRLSVNNTEFTNTKYPLSYANTIFTDSITQIVFTDSIDINLLTDNRCRPLSEFYLTIVKNNESNIKWSGNTWGSYKSKYQRFWGKNTSGFELVNLKSENMVQTSLLNKTMYEENYPSVFYLHNLQESISGEWIEGDPGLPQKIEIIDKPAEPAAEQPGYTRNIEFVYSPKSLQTYQNLGDIDNKNTVEFYGDIVEWSPGDFKEIILSPVCNRFNTTSRESFEWADKMMVFHQIWQDDEDRGFDPNTGGTLLTTEYFPETGIGSEGPSYQIPRSLDDCQDLYSNGTKFVYRGYMNVGPRPEGYYHKAHYKIPIKWYSNKLQQKTGKQIKIKMIQTEICNNIQMIALLTYAKHSLLSGNLIRIHISNKDKNDPPCDKVFIVKCSAIDRTKFLIPMDNDVMIAGINNITVTYYLDDIPQWAQRMDDGSYLWRNILLNDEQDTSNVVDQHEEFPYTNNHFYLHNPIKFYLRRQGMALYYKHYLNDIGPDNYNPDIHIDNPPKDIC
jgi:hypothetical protein